MTKSIIAWVGGKAKLMWLINLLAPNNYDRSIDVFGGSGTVTLNLDCRKSTLRIYNDFNGNLVNLMRCARDKTLALIKDLGFLELNARDDFDVWKKFIEKEEFDDSDLREELELVEIMFDKIKEQEAKNLLIKSNNEKDVKRASTYYKVLRCSYNANADTFGGRKINIRDFFVDIWNFARAFASVVIENKDFEKLIKQYDRENAFIYCDPPYYAAEGFYSYIFKYDDHVRLRDTLVNAKGYVMVSYNNHEIIKDLYKDFYIYYTTRPNSMSKKEGDLYEELIMTNYDPCEHGNPTEIQLNLFGEEIQEFGNYELIHKPEKPLKN